MYYVLTCIITIFSPLPKKQIFRCNILRKKDGIDKLYPKYFVYSYPNDRFLMAARKRPKNKTSNYIITMNHESFDKDENYLAKLRSNFFGTEFNLFDVGSNPNDTEDSNQWRKHLSAIVYETNFFGLKGPRKMKAHISGLNQYEQIREIKPSKKGDGIIDLIKKKDRSIISFENKLPKWNESKHIHILYQSLYTIYTYKPINL
jgi:tubby-related protein 1